MNIVPIYKNRIINLPYEIVSEYLSTASSDELKVLIAVFATPEFDVADLADKLDLTQNSFIRALNKWQDLGIFVIDSSNESKTKKKKDSMSNGAGDNKDNVNKPKTLVRPNLPGYTSDELADTIERNSSYNELINSCEQILGRMFNFQETSIIVGLSEQYSLSNAYLLLLCTYAASINKTSIKYIEKLACEFYDRDIISYTDLEEELNRVKERSSYETFIRKLFGIDKRSFTPKEKNQIHLWRETYGYSDEMINKAYEMTISAINEPRINYTNSIIENWYTNNIKTEKDLEKLESAKKKDKKQSASSYDTDSFFEKVLNESYGKESK